MRVKTRHPGVYYRLDAQERRRYIVWFTDSDGTDRVETLPLGSTEKDAVEYRSTLTADKARGRRVVRSNMRMRELGQEWLATKTEISPKTLEAYQWALTKIDDRMGHFLVADVSTDTVAKFIEAMRKSEFKAWSIRKVTTVLSQELSYAVRRKGIIPVNPVDGLLREEKPKGDQKEMRILSTEEIDKLLGVAEGRWERLWTFLLLTGLRISEALSLEWQDVDLKEGLVHVRESKTEAGVRSVVLTPTLVNLLRKERIATPALCKYVFHTKGGKALMRRNTLRKLADTCDKAGIEKVTQHELRHTYASLLIGQGLDVTFVADQMGHADPAITLKVYAKLFDPAARREEARERIEAAFGGRG